MKDPELMKSTRTLLKLTQSEMADRLGYGAQKDISRIETGAVNMSRQTRQHLLTIRKHETIQAIDVLISVQHSIDNCRADSGAVYLGDKTEKDVRKALEKAGVKFE